MIFSNWMDFYCTDSTYNKNFQTLPKGKITITVMLISIWATFIKYFPLSKKHYFLKDIYPTHLIYSTLSYHRIQVAGFHLMSKAKAYACCSDMWAALRAPYRLGCSHWDEESASGKRLVGQWSMLFSLFFLKSQELLVIPCIHDIKYQILAHTNFPWWTVFYKWDRGSLWFIVSGVFFAVQSVWLCHLGQAT